MIHVSESAGLKMKELLAQQDNENLFIRIGVQGGGCSGFTYGMGFDDTINPDDTELEQHGIKFVMDKDSARILKGLKIDYKENMMGGGFTMDNPNAIATCGCGTSFRTATDEGKPEKCE